MDWKAILSELMNEHSLSQAQIAAHCGCAQPSISAIARGETKDPRHSTGEALKRLLDAKRCEAASAATAMAAQSQVSAPAAPGIGG